MNWDNLTAFMPVAEGHTMPNGNMEPPFGDAFMATDINVLVRHDGCHHYGGYQCNSFHISV
jgi:hypothetical protein